MTVVSLANLHKRPEALAHYYVTSYWQAEWVKKLRWKTIVTSPTPPPPPPPWIEITRASKFQNYFFGNIDIFSDAFSITISDPKILIPFIWRKPVSCRMFTLPAERKKTSTPASLSACSNCLALAMRALYRYGSDLIRSEIAILRKYAN